MIQFITSHPWLLALIGVPALVAALPTMLHKAEVSALKSLFAQGDAADQKALKGIALVAVTWAEEKYGDGKGIVKFEAVDALLAKAIPFISADQRKKLIEDTVTGLDSGVHEAAQ